MKNKSRYSIPTSGYFSYYNTTAIYARCNYAGCIVKLWSEHYSFKEQLTKEESMGFWKVIGYNKDDLVIIQSLDSGKKIQIYSYAISDATQEWRNYRFGIILDN